VAIFDFENPGFCRWFFDDKAIDPMYLSDAGYLFSGEDHRSKT
jgi:hypothetical protein